MSTEWILQKMHRLVHYWGPSKDLLGGEGVWAGASGPAWREEYRTSGAWTEVSKVSGPEGRGLAFLKLSPTFWVGLKAPPRSEQPLRKKGQPRRVDGKPWNGEQGDEGRGRGREAPGGKPQHRPEPSFLHRRKNSLKPLTRKHVPPEVRYAKYQVWR